MSTTIESIERLLPLIESDLLAAALEGVAAAKKKDGAATLAAASKIGLIQFAARGCLRRRAPVNPHACCAVELLLRAVGEHYVGHDDAAQRAARRGREALILALAPPEARDALERVEAAARTAEHRLDVVESRVARLRHAAAQAETYGRAAQLTGYAEKFARRLPALRGEIQTTRDAVARVRARLDI